MSETNRITLTIEDIRATRDTQVFENWSDIQRSPAVLDCEQRLADDPENIELWKEKGLALAKQSLFREAIEAFSVGLSYDPFNWELLRHRGHRYLSVYGYQEAAADFELATRLNPKDWDSWYHLGLSYYLLGDYARAERAYANCYGITDFKDINAWAIVNWRWHALMHLGLREQANEIIGSIDPELEAGENQAYKDIVLCGRGLITPEQAMTFENDEFYDIEFSTRGYGLAMNHLYQGDEEACIALLKEIMDHGKFWSAFGYMAAREDLRKDRI